MIALDRISSRAFLVCVALCAALSPGAVRAEEYGTVPDTVRFRSGWMFADFNTEAQVGIQDSSRGTDLNFEDIFNLPVSKGSLRLEGGWRFKPKHHLDLGYVSFDRTAARDIDRDIDFGDTTFLVGARVTATIDSQFIYAAYRYDFIRAERLRFSGSAGLSWLTMSAGLSATGNFTGPGGSGSGSGSQEAGISFPVPLFGLALEGDISKRIIGSVYARGLWLSSGDLKGVYLESGIAADWYFTRNFGMGLGYDLTSIHIEGANDGDLQAEFDYSFHGPRVFLSFAF